MGMFNRDNMSVCVYLKYHDVTRAEYMAQGTFARRCDYDRSAHIMSYIILRTCTCLHPYSLLYKISVTVTFSLILSRQHTIMITPVCTY